MLVVTDETGLARTLEEASTSGPFVVTDGLAPGCCPAVEVE